MRVCLINPPRIQPKAWGKPNVFPPIVLASVAAVLEKKHAVSIIDAPTEGWRNLAELDESKYRVGLSSQTIAERVREWSPDVIVVEIPFSGWSKTSFEVVDAVKAAAKKDVAVVLMGQHPTARPEACLSEPNVDFVVVGEPENTIFELVDALASGKQDFRGVDGLGFNENGKPMLTGKREFIENLDSLPFPEDTFAYESLQRSRQGKPAQRRNKQALDHRHNYPRLSLQLRFLLRLHSLGRTWRARSPKNVVDELEHVVKTYGVKQVDFYDENMTLDKKRMAEICDLIVERGLHIEWFTPNGVRADTLDEPLLRKMKKSGCKKIRVAPESGVQRIVNEVIGKNLDLKKVEQAVVLCKKVGVKVGCFFVLGMIGETKADIEETIKFAYKLRSLGADSLIFSIAMPLYGTALYEQAKEGGYLREGFCDYALAATEPLIETPQFTANDLRELCIRANMANPTFTRTKILRATRHPKKTLKILLKIR